MSPAFLQTEAYSSVGVVNVAGSSMPRSSVIEAARVSNDADRALFIRLGGAA